MNLLLLFVPLSVRQPVITMNFIVVSLINDNKLVVNNKNCPEYISSNYLFSSCLMEISTVLNISINYVFIYCKVALISVL